MRGIKLKYRVKEYPLCYGAMKFAYISRDSSIRWNYDDDASTTSVSHARERKRKSRTTFRRRHSFRPRTWRRGFAFFFRLSISSRFNGNLLSRDLVTIRSFSSEPNCPPLICEPVIKLQQPRRLFLFPSISLAKYHYRSSFYHPLNLTIEFLEQICLT